MMDIRMSEQILLLFLNKSHKIKMKNSLKLILFLIDIKP